MDIRAPLSYIPLLLALGDGLLYAGPGIMEPLHHYYAVVMDHRGCGLSVVKRLGSVPPDEIYRALRGTPGGVVVLSTCNRVEVYGYGSRGQETLRLLRELYLEKLGLDIAGCASLLKGSEAARHVFRVAAGLESMMVGENEILSQVRRSLEEAGKLGVSRHLRLLFERAVAAGKRVRRETSISRGAISIPVAAVRLAERRLGGLKDRNIVVVGAGKAASMIAAAAARRKPASLLVLNRTAWRARRLAERLGASWGGLDRLPEALTTCDVLFVAVNGGVVVRRSVLEGLRNHLLVVDVSVPPAVEEGAGTVELVWLDSLKRLAAENLEKRLGEVPLASRIVEEELELFARLVWRLEADAVLSRIMGRLEEIRRREVERALRALRARGLGGDDGLRDVIEAMSRSILRKSMQPLYGALREAAERGDRETLRLISAVMGEHP